MIQLTSYSASSYHLFALFFILFVFIDNHSISANSLSYNSDYQSHPSIYNDVSYDDVDDNESPILIYPDSLHIRDNEEIITQNPWSQLLHRQSQRSMFNPTYYPSSQSGFALRNGQVRYYTYPVQKRAIPIELQKALFAHGIVGRRR